ncbi:LysM peptidoglycan-binding domain-containing protein [Flavobacterium sp.]|uniref:C40 family peptidase n=1 Tax=Flavobacterium sp. TaxID=239 RepID=UPI003D6ACA0A
MKFYKLFTFLFVLMSSVVFSQEKIKHSVAKGESVYSIAKKYQVKPSEILELNPKAKKLLKLNMVLLVPNRNYKPEEIASVSAAEPVIHEVLAKETLYGISKKYKISIDKIKEANPTIETEGLKLGAKITIPSAAETITPPTKNVAVTEIKAQVKTTPKQEVAPVAESQNNGEEIVHQVLPKETKYGISKRYKISIQELEKLNPEIANGLSVGHKLIIRKGTPSETVHNQTVSPQIEEEEEEIEVGTSSSQIKIIEIKESEPAPVAEVAPLSLDNMSKAEFLIAKASENLGARYRSGSTGNGGFDCSGLMFATFKNIDMTLPRSSHEMAAGAGVKIDRTQAQKGDLIFFATMGRGRVSHVGMVTEILEDEIKFIHSSTSAGVIISSTREPYYAKRFVQVNRVLN